jgi:hypothetical protein
MMDMPVPRQSSVSAATVFKTGKGKAAGPPLKFKALIEKFLPIELASLAAVRVKRPRTLWPLKAYHTIIF